MPRTIGTRWSSAYRELEIRAIKEETIGEVRAADRPGRSARCPKIAPLSHGQAVEQLNATDAFISANPYAKEGCTPWPGKHCSRPTGWW
jgi:hypothetical protein